MPPRYQRFDPWIVSWDTDYYIDDLYREVTDVQVFNIDTEVDLHNVDSVVLIPSLGLDVYIPIPQMIFWDMVVALDATEEPTLMTYLTISEDALLAALADSALNITNILGFDIDTGMDVTNTLLNALENTLGNMLGDIEFDLNVNHNDLINTNDGILTILDDKLNIIDDEIELLSDTVTTTDTGLIDTILDFFDGIVSDLWLGITDLIASVENTFMDIIIWFDGAWDLMLLNVESTVAAMIETVEGTLSFLINEIWYAVDTALEPIISIIDSLGDLYDWFIVDFFTWLNETFSFTEEDLTTGFSTVMTLFSGILEAQAEKPIT